MSEEATSTATIRGEAIAFLNRKFDVKDASKSWGGKVEKLRGDLEKQREQLAKQVALANQEIPTKINAAVSEGKDAEASIAQVIRQCDSLHDQTKTHLSRCLPLVPSLIAKTRDVQHLEKYVSYLQWIGKIEELSNSIQSSLLAGLMASVADAFSDLVDLSQDLSSTSCYFLYNFARDTVLFWYDVVRDKLAEELEKYLKILGYPVVEGPSKSVANALLLQVSPENKACLETVLSQLLRIELPASFGVSHFGGPKAMMHQLNVFGCALEPHALPMQFILNPLRKRFKFHFCGDKPTNNLSKPEWYFSQALSWVNTHRNVFEEVIQPAFDRVGGSHIQANNEFMRGISLVVMEKLQTDIPELLYDETLFCHAINEALLFHRSLVENYDYPSSFPSVLHILCQEKSFQRWITVEKKFAQERIDLMLSCPSAWNSPQTELTDVTAISSFSPQSSFATPDVGAALEVGVVEGSLFDAVGVSSLRVPECVESFVTQLYVLRERSAALPGPLPKLHFLELQLNLLEDFHLRMTQVKSGEKGNPMGIKFTSVLNGVHYILTVLREWREHPHYVQLSWFHDQYAAMIADSSLAPPFGGGGAGGGVESAVNNTTTDVSLISALETSKSYTFSAFSAFSERLRLGVDPALDNNNAVVDNNNKNDVDVDVESAEDDLKKSVFDKIVTTYEHLRTTMLKDIVYAVMTEIKSRSQAYKREKWTQIPSACEWVSLSLSSSACEMLLILKSRFHILGLYLSPPNMALVWQRIARDLNKFVYEEVILPNHFSDGGAAQLKYDMERNLFPIFGEFTKKPENYFKEVKEACALLTLPVGSARLLRETVTACRNAASSIGGGMLGLTAAADGGGDGAREALAEAAGIHKLSTEHALALLNQQTSVIAHV